jgi:hypothetical protein
MAAKWNYRWLHVRRDNGVGRLELARRDIGCSRRHDLLRLMGNARCSVHDPRFVWL